VVVKKKKRSKPGPRKSRPKKMESKKKNWGKVTKKHKKEKKLTKGKRIIGTSGPRKKKFAMGPGNKGGGNQGEKMV